MSAELIYRTESAAAIAWRLDYTRKWLDAKEHWDRFELDVELEFGIPEGEKHRSLYMVSGAVIGIVRTADEWADRRNYAARFPGWKEHQRYPALSPKLNTKLGKEWQAKIDALPVLDMRKEARAIGIPDYVMTDHHLFSAGIDYDTDDDGHVTSIYQSWGSGRCADQVERAMAEHPEVEWLEVPRSSWYARLEAREHADA